MTIQVTNSEVRQAVSDFELRELFNALGWDNFSDQQYITVADDSGDEQYYELNAVAQKRGMIVFTVVADTDGSLPDSATRKKIERELSKLYTEHFIVYASDDKREQVWQWAKREAGKPTTVREHRFENGAPTESLVQRIQGIAFSIDEEEDLDALDVFGRVQASFDVEKVTKKFYENFQKEHDTFLEFVEGLDDLDDRRWYASIMLNRLMFVYFVQRKGFLDGNRNYLRDKLNQMKSGSVDGNFLTFYRRFLLKLFHQGLGQAESSRDAGVDDLIGDIPYLNGGLFDIHHIEENNSGLDIPDSAFERIFDFFDRYDWHLDERPLKNSNEINPDVLGYIFEKYINQKQMGAYYTQEDVTGYISQNTVIPYLFDATEEECHIAFEPESAMWKLLTENPDRYIYDAVRKGVDAQLPDWVAAGAHDVSERNGWNRAAGGEYALPTETWREHVTRRRRCHELRAKLSGGEVHNINDLVTLNLNIRQFAQDAVVGCEGADFLRAFYKAIREVSVLDPTVGSGAFLFAALNVLEPLYDACLERMQQFVDEDSTGERYSDFRENLAEVASHPSRRYFILKSIMVKNLYGVDIMDEAVEIARLRLFLKLTAQLEERSEIEPLPDLDFNLRAGNTFVGFSSMAGVEAALEKRLDFSGSAEKIQADGRAVDEAFQEFQRKQLGTYANSSTGLDEAKNMLELRLSRLNTQLDRYLAMEYGVDPEDSASLELWLHDYKPFHWLIDFYRIVQAGGFKVILGNPPYVEYSKVKQIYTLKSYETISCGNLHAFALERSKALLKADGRLSLIVPISLPSTPRMQPAFRLLQGEVWLTHFAVFPQHLFEGVHQRITVFSYKPGDETRIWSSKYTKWTAPERTNLFANLALARSIRSNQGVIAKTGSDLALSVVEKIYRCQQTVEQKLSRTREHTLYYKNTGINNWIVVTSFAPACKINGVEEPSSRETHLYCKTALDAAIVGAVLNSSTFFFYYTQFSNCRDLNPSDVKQMKIPKGLENEDLQALAEALQQTFNDNSQPLVRNQKQTGRVEIQSFRPRLSKPTIDKIDRILARHYGFTDEELDFIINYDIKYRMGVEGT